jgi:hypothetical protein
MRSRSPIDLLLYEANRKPEIARIVAELDDMDESAIDALLLPLPWYRDALRRLKRKNAREQVGQIGLHDLDGHVVYGVVPDPMGEIRVFTAPTCFVPIGKNRTLVEVQTGKLLWFADADGFWFETLFTPAVDPHVFVFTKFAARASLTAYRFECQERLAARMGVNRDVVSTDSSMNSGYITQPSIAGVQFFR